MPQRRPSWRHRHQGPRRHRIAASTRPPRRPNLSDAQRDGAGATLERIVMTADGSAVENADRVLPDGLAGLAPTNGPDRGRHAGHGRNHEQTIEDVFVQMLRLCAAAGLVTLGTVAVDGTKVGSDAALNRSKRPVDPPRGRGHPRGPHATPTRPNMPRWVYSPLTSCPDSCRAPPITKPGLRTSGPAALAPGPRWQERALFSPLRWATRAGSHRHNRPVGARLRRDPAVSEWPAREPVEVGVAPPSGHPEAIACSSVAGTR
jgi:hypothetical protein